MPVSLPPAKKESPIKKTKGTALTQVLQAMTLAGVFLVLFFVVESKSRNAAGSALSAAQTRDLASKLKAAGALKEAGRIYEQFLNQTDTADVQRASISFSLGNLFLDLGEYEKALRWFYESELSESKEIEEEVGKKIVHCLEAMGRIHAAKAALDRRTSLDQPGAERAQNDPIVATIGKDRIHRSDVTRALDDLPPVLQQRFAGPEGAKEFLKKYVADALLFEKAKKLEIDQDPEVTRTFQTMLKQLTINRFVETQILDKLEIDPADLKNYYEANREKYDEPEKATIRLIKTATQKEARELIKKIQAGSSFASLARTHSLHTETKDTGGLLKNPVRRGEPILEQGDAQAISELIFSTPAGRVSEPVEIDGFYYLFSVDSKQPGQQRSFQEVAKQVETNYRIMKSSAAYNQLIQDTLTVEDVELFPEKMAETSDPKTMDPK